MAKLILVTGGAGFLGSNLVRRLVADGHRVICLDNYFAGSPQNHVAGAEYREGHTKDIERLVPEIPDLVYHLGEYSRVEQSLLEPDIVHDLNTIGTAAVVAYWKKKKCKLVYAGSSTKFGDGGASRSATPYAATKAANTELVKEEGDANHLPYAITYFYNVYGPGERADAYGTVIEMWKHMYLRGTPITVTTPGTQARNFTHVDDIVEGLILVGEKGEGDEYGLGNEASLSLLDVAHLFGGEVVMMPERPGNRMSSSLDATKSLALGWQASRRLEEYIREFVSDNPPGTPLDKRILLFSPTFYPVSGPAEDALLAFVRSMPDVEFDLVTTYFDTCTKGVASPAKNLTVYRVGNCTPFDKYLLPVLGFFEGHKLVKKHSYLFAWALFASYAALAAVAVRRVAGLPLLITLADQDLSAVPAWKRFFLRLMLTDADQVYGLEPADEQNAARIARKEHLRRSMGRGDAFANQIRFAYSSILATCLINKTPHP